MDCVPLRAGCILVSANMPLRAVCNPHGIGDEAASQPHKASTDVPLENSRKDDEGQASKEPSDERIVLNKVSGFFGLRIISGAWLLAWPQRHCAPFAGCCRMLCMQSSH